MPSFIKYNRFPIPRSHFFIIIVVQNFLFRKISGSFLLFNFCGIFCNIFFKFIFGGNIIIFDFLLFQNYFIRFEALLKFSSDYHKSYTGEKFFQRIKYSLDLLLLVLIINIRFTAYSFWSFIDIASEVIEVLFFRL
jgi:hypothetical protein